MQSTLKSDIYCRTNLKIRRGLIASIVKLSIYKQIISIKVIKTNLKIALRIN